MTIDQAIEKQERYLQHPYLQQLPELQKAMQLGIEALKLVDNLRFDGSPYYPKLLPGETEE